MPADRCMYVHTYIYSTAAYIYACTYIWRQEFYCCVSAYVCICIWRQVFYCSSKLGSKLAEAVINSTWGSCKLNHTEVECTVGSLMCVCVCMRVCVCYRGRGRYAYFFSLLFFTVGRYSLTCLFFFYCRQVLVCLFTVGRDSLTPSSSIPIAAVAYLPLKAGILQPLAVAYLLQK
jgi:hypothetical protein